MKFTIHSSRSRTNLITPSVFVFVFCFEGDLLIEVLFRLARGYHLHYLRIESKTTGKTCVHMFDGRRINGFKLVSNMSIFFFSAINFCCLGPFRLKQPASASRGKAAGDQLLCFAQEGAWRVAGGCHSMEMKHCLKHLMVGTCWK